MRIKGNGTTQGQTPSPEKRESLGEISPDKDKSESPGKDLAKHVKTLIHIEDTTRSESEMFDINDMVHKQSDELRKQAKNNYKEQVKSKMMDNVNTTDTIDSSDQIESEKEADFSVDALLSKVKNLNEAFKQKDIPKQQETVVKMVEPVQKEKLIRIKVSAEKK